MILTIKNLSVKVDTDNGELAILSNLDLKIEEGKTHVVMGPNGSGKSTLAQVLMGSPVYEVKSGKVNFRDKNLFDMDPTERSLSGLFLSFQYPNEIPGVSVSNFLRTIYNKHQEQVGGKKLTPVKFREYLKSKLEILDMDESFMHRYLNDGFSGGEKKRMEMLQMLVLKPSLVILDEVDSGLDIDALKVVAKAVNLLKEKGVSFLIITHYTRILKHIEPDFVHVMKNGKIVESGGKDLAEELESKGYAPFGNGSGPDENNLDATR